jgi:methionyl aminopeptidase
MILFKSPWEMDLLRVSNRIAAEALTELKKLIEPGINTAELDRFAESFLRRRGAKPAFKGYNDYPNTLCTSINEGVVHGIPSSRKLQEGDIISLDIGTIYSGYYGDAAITLPVGKISPEAERLLRITETALSLAIEKARSGYRVSDISHAIQEHVESQGMFVVRAFVGHGIGKSLHEEPQIPNFGPPGKGPLLRPGMVLAIEPMVNLGTSEIVILEDKWTAVTKDRSLSAHFEHTVAITENGTEILTFLDGHGSEAKRDGKGRGHSGRRNGN